MILQAGMRYFVLRPDDKNYPLQWFLGEPLTNDEYEVDPREFTAARSFRGPLPATVPICNPGTELAFSFGAFDMPVVTNEVAEIIRNLAGDDVETFPVRIPGAKQSYSILNVVRSLRCLDEVRSEFTLWTEADERPEEVGEYRHVSTIRIDPQRTQDRHVFRIQGYELALIVTEVVKVALANVRDLGLYFKTAS